MDLRPYVENIHRQLIAAAEAGGEDSRAVAERLIAPLDAAFRLALQEMLAAAAEDITTELAPGSVELRVRGRALEFVVTPPPADQAATPEPTGATVVPPTAIEGDEGAMARINVRMPDHLKARVDRAADSEGLSINAWLVRAAATALGRADAGPQPEPHSARGAQRHTGWAR